MRSEVTIIGAGLAGSEAAWQLLKRGFKVHMIEMRPLKTTPAHQTNLFAELVCSNSLRSDDAQTNAVGLLHHEMRQLDSLIMKCADETRVPAGGALAVNRTDFAAKITNKVNQTVKEEHKSEVKSVKTDVKSESVKPKDYVTDDQFFDDFFADDDD